MNRAQVSFVFDPSFSLDPGEYPIDSPNFGELPEFYFATDVDEALQEVRADCGCAIRSEMSRSPIRDVSISDPHEILRRIARHAVLAPTPTAAPSLRPQALDNAQAQLAAASEEYLEALPTFENPGIFDDYDPPDINASAILKSQAPPRPLKSGREPSRRNFRVISAHTWHDLGDFTPCPRRAERALGGHEGGHV